MADLFTSLHIASRSLEAQRFGLDVTGHNIANVNTPGYTRRVAEFSAVAPLGPRDAGGGVDITGVHASRDRLIERRLYQELPAERREAAIADVLRLVETALGQPGASIDGQLGRFFDAVSQLADAPTSAVARQEVVVEAQALAASFRDMSDRLTASRRDADNAVRAAAGEVNALAGRIGELNRAIGSTVDKASVLHLQDEQAALVRQVSELLDVSVLDRADGGVDISFGNGRPLVIGQSVYGVSAVSGPPAGLSELVTNGATVTTEITGGRLGGLLHARDVLVPEYLSQIDALAQGVAGEINARHAAGYGLDGGTGRDLFTLAPAGGAAAGIGVDAAIAADPRLVAAGSTTAAGDNATARAIAALREAPVLPGGASMAETWSQIVHRVGRDARTAIDEQASRIEIVRQVDALRDQVSGVSLDEEAMHLLKFQRAYEANARFFSTVDRALETLLQMVAR